MEYLAMRLVPVLSRLTELDRYDSIPEPLRLEVRQLVRRLYDRALDLLARPAEISGAGHAALREEIAGVDAALESAASDPARLDEAIARVRRLESAIRRYLEAHARE